MAASTTPIPIALAEDPSVQKVGVLLIAAAILAVAAPCFGTFALAVNWHKPTIPRRIFQVFV